jgi:hypothetical protein
MKGFLFGILFLILVGVGGFFWLKYSSQSPADSQTYKTEAITRTGKLQKSATTEGVDYTHQIISGGTYYGVNSYSLKLDEYVGKNVEATGQNSGTTLYIDSITVLP